MWVLTHNNLIDRPRGQDVSGTEGMCRVDPRALGRPYTRFVKAGFDPFISVKAGFDQFERIRINNLQKISRSHRA